ncbi:SH22A protein, partial [Sitta europaea]|nr:SH22A protein [Sitta europaea]
LWTGDTMDDDCASFITFKPLGEDNTSRAKPAPNTIPLQPQGAEQSLGQHNRHGRVGHGDMRVDMNPAHSLPAQSLPEQDPWPERVALRARTRLWFEQTQAQRLGPAGELPTWFHGFISRREAEELLQDQPLGCFLVRFSESTIGFVLSYRGRDRCRHFVLDQLPDGRYVILGERSAHAELAELLQHHATAPVTPYHEFLTVPLPCTRVSPHLRPVPSLPQAPSAPPSLPAKTRAPRSPASSAAAPEAPYAQVRRGDPRPEPPEAKYQQLMCFHVYAEPREDIAPSEAEEPTPVEPIPFYAMARGWSPRAGPEENIYSEV